MQAFIQMADEKQTGQVCHVAVIYEDTPTRNCAMQVHDHLMREFGLEIDFDFHWWRADFLVHPETGNLAVADTEQADIFIVCTRPDSDISQSLKRWLADWSERHAGHEGALLDLTGIAPGFPVHAWEVKFFLREMARRATLDYLEINPPAPRPGQFFTESIPQPMMPTNPPSDYYRNESQPPSQYGLND